MKLSHRGEINKVNKRWRHTKTQFVGCFIEKKLEMVVETFGITHVLFPWIGLIRVYPCIFYIFVSREVANLGDMQTWKGVSQSNFRNPKFIQVANISSKTVRETYSVHLYLQLMYLPKSFLICCTTRKSFTTFYYNLFWQMNNIKKSTKVLHFCYKQLGSGLSPQSCLYFQGFWGSKLLNNPCLQGMQYFSGFKVDIYDQWF